MIPLEELVLALVTDLPLGAGQESVAVHVTGVEVSVPVEQRIAPDGQFRVSLPRGRWRSGFSLPHARISMSLARSEDA